MQHGNGKVIRYNVGEPIGWLSWERERYITRTGLFRGLIRILSTLKIILPTEILYGICY